MHSTMSDGSDTFEQVLEQARERGVGRLAFTNHDTTAGLTAARELGERLGVEVVGGVEVSACDFERGRKVHILGLGLREGSPAVEALCATLNGGEMTLEKVAQILPENPAVQSVSAILSAAQALADGRYGVKFDLSLVRGQGYYTGTVFEVESNEFRGAIAGGGRYDNLPRKMGKQVGAIGFALSMGLLEERADGGRFDADVLLTYGPDAELAGLAAFAEALRASGRSVRCERAGGSAQLRCRTELRYRSGMTPEEVGL